MANTRKRRLVPYWQPPENPISDERHALLLTFVWEIRNAQGSLTAEQLANRLLTRLDLRGWKPEEYRAALRRQRWQDAEKPAPEVAAEGLAAVRAELAKTRTERPQR